MNKLAKLLLVESKFNFNIDIENSNNSLSKSKHNPLSLILEYDLLVKYTVDLGLPSGTRWYKYNLGADIEHLELEDSWYGDYYAWGELKAKGISIGYDWDTYRFGIDSKLKKYNKKDKLTLLLPEDDAAYKNLHLHNFKFCIPSKKLFEELLTHTTNEHVKGYNDIKYLEGTLIKGKNGLELFLPYAGRAWQHDIYNVIDYGYYMSADLDLSEYECDSYWAFCASKVRSSKTEAEIVPIGIWRSVGSSIRPVYKKEI